MGPEQLSAASRSSAHRDAWFGGQSTATVCGWRRVCAAMVPDSASLFIAMPRTEVERWAETCRADAHRSADSPVAALVALGRRVGEVTGSIGGSPSLYR